MKPFHALARLRLAFRILCPGIKETFYMFRIHRSGIFDRAHYINQIKGLHVFWRMFPLRHYIIKGEKAGLTPGPNFSPNTYLRLNPDVAAAGLSPLWHYIHSGAKEARILRGLEIESLPPAQASVLRFDPGRLKERFAIHLHLYYPDLWPEFRTYLQNIDIKFDLFVTLTWRGPETTNLTTRIKECFPDARVFPTANRGRDILPFVTLVNAGAFDGYEAVCKLHGKKSLHREDGAVWRKHLVSGVLPIPGLAPKLEHFLANQDAAFWVADGQSFQLENWRGSNREKTDALLRRLELDRNSQSYDFPAGSIYWLKPLMIGLIRALDLNAELFEPEEGQLDGTLAHAFERGIGALAAAAGQVIIQTSELKVNVEPAPKSPRYVSAFYLPQFHPIPENDKWWGPGYSEWSAVADTVSAFPGHLQPTRPADLGYYDLRLPETMEAQAKLARSAGVDGFCVYHYWFGGRRLLETPLDKLLRRPEIDFPFYLCWANESWCRNWDGLSGEILLPQNYAPGFEAALAASTIPYMADPRYQRPDGRRPRFVIYRPEDLPAPVQNIARLRNAWRAAGIGEVELGAVSFHVAGGSDVPPEAFDFWIEMPPHGLVDSSAYLFGGSAGNLLGETGPAPDFQGLIYDYQAIAQRSVSTKYRKGLPAKTITGIMPSWDNVARRKNHAHIARGANPASFRRWLRMLQQGPLDHSYRGELFINAWNEWGEKAMLEPCQKFGHLNLDVLREATNAGARNAVIGEVQNA